MVPWERNAGAEGCTVAVVTKTAFALAYSTDWSSSLHSDLIHRHSAAWCTVFNLNYYKNIISKHVTTAWPRKNTFLYQWVALKFGGHVLSWLQLVWWVTLMVRLNAVQLKMICPYHVYFYGQEKGVHTVSIMYIIFICLPILQILLHHFTIHNYMHIFTNITLYLLWT